MISEMASKEPKSGTDIPAWRLCVNALLEKKASDIVALDVHGISSFADTFVIASGQSTRQVAALGEHLIRRLKEEGTGLLGVEGLKEGRWALIDLGDVVVHIFFEPVREFYDIEGLWSDAEQAYPEET